jgi:hypothetical protein
MPKEYIPAHRVKELASWLLEDPLIGKDVEANERLIRSYDRLWSNEEKRWIKPNNSSRERIIRAALG